MEWVRKDSGLVSPCVSVSVMVFFKQLLPELAVVGVEVRGWGWRWGGGAVWEV